jgi:hypothetical protein
MSFDRFIRPINSDIFYLHSRSDEPKIQTVSELEHRDMLTHALFGTTWSQAQSMSVFSPPSTRYCSPFSDSLSPRWPLQIQALKLDSPHPTKVLAGPSLHELSGASSRLIAPLKPETYLLSCAKAIYRIVFRPNGNYEPTEIYNARELPTLSHIAALDPATLSMIAADVDGQLHFFERGEGALLARRKDPVDPIIDLFSRDRSSFIFATERRGLALGDIRSRHIALHGTSPHSLCLAGIPGSPCVATGSESGISLFDIQSLERPVWTMQANAPATAIALKANRMSKTLLAATGGPTPTLHTFSIGRGPAPLSSTPTFGIVSSILCSKTEGTIITPRQTPFENIVVWEHRESEEPHLLRTSYGGFCRGDTQCQGAIGEGGQSFILSYPGSECFAYWKLIPPQSPRDVESSVPDRSFDQFSIR